ncbi:hypothetical protein GFS03_04405 [Sulfolobus sp. E5-1-F]|uniref:hypothetical protein n=1 Tax=Saccharolobus sp. E5-1-F TaxID=2663019 RepID=UPI001296F8EE|nr:hypothetical protein [Sulfolobus sp. E5-1-F]QGA53873.1 hypothetical protein GFS03_04405 [Sulfolobus sp. E5-1-F]
MNRRDRTLLKKVGGYYLQYKGIVDVEKLLSTFNGTEEVPLDDYTLSYIYYYLMYLITASVVRSAEDAKKSRLTYKEFSIEYSNDLYGELNVDLSIPVYSMGLVAYHSFTEGYNAPEYGILGYIMRRIYSIIKEKRSKIEVRKEQIPRYFNFLDDFDRTFSRVDEIKEEFPDGYFRDPSYTDPDWLLRAYKAYFMAKELEEIKVGIRTPKKPINKKLIKFIMWKLYELYIFYLVVNYLESKGYEIKKEEDKYIAIRGNKRLSIIFNASLGQSSLRKVDYKEDVEKYKGRPDISLTNERPIIFECKYSSKVSYITMGRFKIMAYTYEYDPSLAVLVYPGLETEQISFDNEDNATMELDKIARKESGILDFLYNNHLLYMAIIDPLELEKNNLSKLDKIMKKHI